MYDKKYTEDPEFRKIITILEDIKPTGLFNHSTGHCFAMSDICCNLLYQHGIKSKLVECSLTIIGTNPPIFHLVGHSGIIPRKEESEVQTHVVCITDTKYPVLLDLSIKSPYQNIPYICLPLEMSLVNKEDGEKNNNIILRYKFDDNLQFTYTKKSPCLPQIYEQDYLSRINSERKIKKTINYLKTAVTLLIIISTMNFSRGLTDYYYKYINRNNGFGLSNR